MRLRGDDLRELQARAAAREAWARKNAFEDPNAFIEYAGKIEGGRRPVQSAVHREWQKLISDHSKVILWAPHYHGKTNQISRWRSVHDIGRNPNLRIALIGETNKLPKKILSGIKADIVDNERTKHIFPELRPAGRNQPQAKWSDDMITVDREDVALDPTIQCVGAYGQIVGSRLDRIYIDDLLSLKYTLTEYQREKMLEWLQTEVFSRLTKGGKIVFVGTAWHQQDSMHVLAKKKGWASRKYQATYLDDDGVEKSLAPELFSVEEIYERADLLGGAQHLAARRMLWNETRPDGGGMIQWSWIEKCLQRGRGRGFLTSWNGPSFSGVDISASLKGGGAEDCIFSLGLMPEGSRRILDIRGGQWRPDEFVGNLQAVDRMFDGEIRVESNGIQKKLAQLVGAITALPITEHHTGMNKHGEHSGIQAMGLEFKRGKWIVPCDEDLTPDDETAKFLQQLVDYAPDQHTGDYAMAGWIAREGARQYQPPGIRQIPVDMLRR